MGGNVCVIHFSFIIFNDCVNALTFFTFLTLEIFRRRSDQEDGKSRWFPKLTKIFFPKIMCSKRTLFKKKSKPRKPIVLCDFMIDIFYTVFGDNGKVSGILSDKILHCILYE